MLSVKVAATGDEACGHTQISERDASRIVVLIEKIYATIGKSNRQVPTDK